MHFKNKICEASVYHLEIRNVTKGAAERGEKGGEEGRGEKSNKERKQGGIQMKEEEAIEKTTTKNT